MAHECVHWYKHKNYHLYNSDSDNQKAVAYRYPIIKKDECFQNEWDDVDWMELQANGIAPRILMPVQTFKTAVEQILEESGDDSIPQWYVVNQISGLYEVSKQSAEIRMNELGITI